MKKLMAILLGIMLVVSPWAIAQQRNIQIKKDAQPRTREFTGSVQLTMRFPADQVVELVEWQVSLATPVANTVTVVVARGTVTNQFQDLMISSGDQNFQTVFWTDPVGISLIRDDTIIWSNSASASAAQLTYKFRHPGE